MISPDAILTLPVPAVSVTLEAAPEAVIVTASVTFSVEVILTELPVAVISISSPAAAPEAEISIPPAVDMIVILSAALSVALILTDPPVLTMSIS